MTRIRIVGQMICRNEFDIIQETIAEAFRWVDAFVVLDGWSDDGTRSLLHTLAAEYGDRRRLLVVHSRPDDADEFHDHYRNELLRMTYRLVEPGDWILSIDADEIYHVDPEMQQGIDPRTAIELAEDSGANVVRSMVPEFWLTFEDLRRGALDEDETISVQQRRRWYSWGHMGTFAWKVDERHYYPANTPRRTPDVPGVEWKQWQRAGPAMTICKHYPIRGLRQGLKRAEERNARGKGHYFGKYKFSNTVIVDEVLAGLHYLDPENEAWIMENNRAGLHAYMAGELSKRSKV